MCVLRLGMWLTHLLSPFPGPQEKHECSATQADSHSADVSVQRGSPTDRQV